MSARITNEPSGKPWSASHVSASCPTSLRTSGQIDEVVVGTQLLRAGEPFGQHGIAGCVGEEGIPVLGSGLDVVQAMTNVGEDAVDVQNGPWHGLSLGRRHHTPCRHR